MTAELLRISAPAKINLALHVTGRRDDGHHALDSLVVFPGLCDEITLEPADKLTISVTGPRAAGVPGDETNIALKAANALRDRGGVPHRGAHIHLIKHIPHSAGLGGGSADAAAVLRGVNQLWDTGFNEPALAELGLTLGADVPACLYGQPARMRGIGGHISPVSLKLKGKPALLLVNPGVAIPTKAVFSTFGSSFGAPLSTLPENGWSSVGALTGFLRENRNDLEEPAQKRAPVIGKVLDLLRGRPHCHLARMSGSGATCFGVFPEERWAWKAMLYLRDRNPGWWFAQAPLGREGEAIVAQNG